MQFRLFSLLSFVIISIHLENVSSNKPSVENRESKFVEIRYSKDKPKSQTALVAEPENIDATEQRPAAEGNDIKRLDLTCCGTWVYG